MQGIRFLYAASCRTIRNRKLHLTEYRHGTADIANEGITIFDKPLCGAAGLYNGYSMPEYDDTPEPTDDEIERHSRLCATCAKIAAALLACKEVTMPLPPGTLTAGKRVIWRAPNGALQAGWIHMRRPGQPYAINYKSGNHVSLTSKNIVAVEDDA